MDRPEVECRAADLSVHAWRVRRSARVIGTTKVGCAVLSSTGGFFVGCNVEHRYRSHDIHAEVNALGNLVSGGDDRAVAVLIAARRKRFTPCGSCMDWIFEIGGEFCWVGFQAAPDEHVEWLLAQELMPHYPI
ncbi:MULTISPECIES: cytidine deaminase [Gordonia]|uniref:cytidine deaminase n=1 Tax=Gordonia TaxID=2053 RepID=UPI003396AA67